MGGVGVGLDMPGRGGGGFGLEAFDRGVAPG
jgi:hypothetical protein